MEVRDSRRLTGPNIVTPGPAAILDLIVGPEDDVAQAVETWERFAAQILDAVGWSGQPLHHRSFHAGLSLAFEAPIDALYAATEVNEWAWEAANKVLNGDVPPECADAAPDLRRKISEESNPQWLALEAAAEEHGVAFLWDDDHLSVGLGVGSQTWPTNRVPEVESIDWSQISDVPVAQVTGTNGKTTTVRLLGAMIRAANRVPGVSSTDWIAAGDSILDRGDYSGPGGARQVLRDPRVETAVLETARGGMLRRGLALCRTDVALVNNLAEDHLGEYGVHDLRALGESKFIVARAAEHLVLNADDPLVREMGEPIDLPKTWFTLKRDNAFVGGHVDEGGSACTVEWGRIVYREGSVKRVIAEVAEVPMTLGGAARHNVANALAAVSVAFRLGLSLDAVREGLLSFESTPESNPGRLNTFEIGGAQIILDFAHNPHGVDALLEMAASLPATRRLVTIGQAGDRDDAAILALAQSTWKTRPDRILIKELDEYLRGREAGEVREMLDSELRRLGADDDVIAHTGSEVETAEAALDWAEPGDLVLLIVHSGRDAVIDFLRSRES